MALSVNDVSVTEGNTGSVLATFTVSLSASSNQTITVNYATANRTVPSPAQLASYNAASWGYADAYHRRVTGGFTGTTDEIIQWAACKWGWSDNVVRAQAIRESEWHQDALGDKEGAGSSHCTHDNPGGECATCRTTLDADAAHQRDPKAVGTYALPAALTFTFAVKGRPVATAAGTPDVS